jgi:hypothetical protein
MFITCQYGKSEFKMQWANKTTDAGPRKKINDKKEAAVIRDSCVTTMKVTDVNEEKIVSCFFWIRFLSNLFLHSLVRH